MFLEFEGAAHYLPAYASNLDIMTQYHLEFRDAHEPKGPCALPENSCDKLAANDPAFMQLAPRRLQVIRLLSALPPARARPAASTGYSPVRLAEVDDIADMVIFLCGDRARHIIGQVLTADGGRVLNGFQGQNPASVAGFDPGRSATPSASVTIAAWRSCSVPSGSFPWRAAGWCTNIRTSPAP